MLLHGYLFIISMAFTCMNKGYINEQKYIPSKYLVLPRATLLIDMVCTLLCVCTGQACLPHAADPFTSGLMYSLQHQQPSLQGGSPAKPLHWRGTAPKNRPATSTHVLQQVFHYKC